MHVVLVVSLVSGVVGLLLATKLYVLQEIFAGLLSLAIVFGVAVVVLVVFNLLREVWQCLYRVK